VRGVAGREQGGVVSAAQVAPQPQH